MPVFDNLDLSVSSGDLKSLLPAAPPLLDFDLPSSTANVTGGLGGFEPLEDGALSGTGAFNDGAFGVFDTYTVPDTPVITPQHILSARGTFQREQLIPPTDVPNLKKQRFYQIYELDDAFNSYQLSYSTERNLENSSFADTNNGSIYPLYMLQGLTRQHKALVDPANFFDGRRVLYSTGRNFIQASIEGIVFLGPLGQMSNVFIRLLETFFDDYGLGRPGNVNPINLREDENLYSAYVHSLIIEPPDLDTHIVRFSMGLFIDPENFYQNTSALFSTIYFNELPDCSKDKWGPKERYRAPYEDYSTEDILFRNLDTTVKAQAAHNNLRNKAFGIASGVGNVGVVGGATQMALSGSGVNTEPAKPEGFLSKLIGGSIQIGASYLQDKAQSAVNRATNKMIDKVGLGGGSGVLGQVGGYVENMIGGKIKDVAGNVISDILYGKTERFTVDSPRTPSVINESNLTAGFAYGQSTDEEPTAADTFSYGLFAKVDPSVEADRQTSAPGLDWWHAILSGALGPEDLKICKGFGATSAKPMSTGSSLPGGLNSTDGFISDEFSKAMAPGGSLTGLESISDVNIDLGLLDIATSEATSALQSKVNDLASAATSVAQSALSNISPPALPKGLIGATGSIISGAISDIAGGALDLAGGVLGGAMGAVSDARQLAGGLSGLANSTLSNLTSAVTGGVVGAVTDSVSGLVGSVSGALGSNLPGGLSGAAESVVSNTVNAAVGAVGNAVANAIPPSDSLVPDVPPIP